MQEVEQWLRKIFPAHNYAKISNICVLSKSACNFVNWNGISQNKLILYLSWVYLILADRVFDDFYGTQIRDFAILSAPTSLRAWTPPPPRPGIRCTTILLWNVNNTRAAVKSIQQEDTTLQANGFLRGRELKLCTKLHNGPKRPKMLYIFYSKS